MELSVLNVTVYSPLASLEEAAALDAGLALAVLALALDAELAAALDAELAAALDAALALVLDAAEDPALAALEDEPDAHPASATTAASIAAAKAIPSFFIRNIPSADSPCKAA